MRISKKRYDAAIVSARDVGYQQGLRAGIEEEKRNRAALNARKEANSKAITQMSELARANAQLCDAIARAICEVGERGL